MAGRWGGGSCTLAFLHSCHFPLFDNLPLKARYSQFGKRRHRLKISRGGHNGDLLTTQQILNSRS